MTGKGEKKGADRKMGVDLLVTEERVVCQVAAE